MPYAQRAPDAAASRKKRVCVGSPDLASHSGDLLCRLGSAVSVSWSRGAAFRHWVLWDAVYMKEGGLGAARRIARYAQLSAELQAFLSLRSLRLCMAPTGQR